MGKLVLNPNEPTMDVRRELEARRIGDLVAESEEQLTDAFADLIRYYKDDEFRKLSEEDFKKTMPDSKGDYLHDVILAKFEKYACNAVLVGES